MKTIQFLFSGLSALTGLFVFFKPALTIEIQKRFYAHINWRIEPIDLQKELRNTRIMGAFLFLIALVIMFLTFQTESH